MMTLLMQISILSFALFFLVNGALGDVSPICTPYAADPNDPALPGLPDQFSLSIEAVLVERNVSVFANEHFDGVNNRAQMDFNGPRGKINTILDYNLREAFVYPNPRTGDDCTVSILNLNTTNPEVQFIFGIVPGPNNTVHIGSPSRFFNLINISNATYLGVEPSLARGIPTFHWQTCNNSVNISYTIDYYFTNSSLWPRTTEDGYIPVLIVLNSSRVNMSTGQEYSVLHYYSFVNYQSGPGSVPDEVFNIPLDLVCKGRLPGQSLPQFPDVFSTNVEVVFFGNVVSYEEYYDYTHQLIRFDGYILSPQSRGVFSVIHDFSIGVQYFLKQNDNYCSVGPLTRNNAIFDGTMDSDGDFHLQSVRNLLLANSEYDFVYEGVSTVRGISVDVWLSYRSQEIVYNQTFYNVTYNLFFSRPGQTLASEFGATTNPVLVQTKFKAVLARKFSNGTTTMTNISSTSNVFGFTPSEPPLDAFVTLDCLSTSDYRQINFRVPLTTAPPTQDKFRSNIRTAFMEYAKRIGMPFLSPLQINNIKIDTRSIPSAILVSLYVTNIPANASVSWRYSVQDIVSQMTMGLFNNSRLPFTIRFNGTSGTDEVYPLYISATTVASDCSGQAPVSVAVGSSLAALLLGIIVGLMLGLVFCFFFQRCKTTGSLNPFLRSKDLPSKYERQVDDVTLQ